MLNRVDSASSLNMPRKFQIRINRVRAMIKIQDFGAFVLTLMCGWDAVYIAILVISLILFALIMKFLRECECDVITEQEPASETNRLLQADRDYLNYGSCEEDVEAREWSSSSSEDLCDGKICTICYDHQRNCFFVPCGHCITCYVCAQRIIEGESKTCPICRRPIHKVRKLFDFEN